MTGGKRAGWYRFLSLLIRGVSFLCEVHVPGGRASLRLSNAIVFVYPTPVIWDEHGGDRKVLAFLWCWSVGNSDVHKLCSFVNSHTNLIKQSNSCYASTTTSRLC